MLFKAETVNSLSSGTGKPGGLLVPTNCCWRQLSTTPIFDAHSGTDPTPEWILEKMDIAGVWEVYSPANLFAVSPLQAYGGNFI